MVLSIKVHFHRDGNNQQNKPKPYVRNKQRNRRGDKRYEQSTSVKFCKNSVKLSNDGEKTCGILQFQSKPVGCPSSPCLIHVNEKEKISSKSEELFSNILNSDAKPDLNSSEGSKLSLDKCTIKVKTQARTTISNNFGKHNDGYRKTIELIAKSKDDRDQENVATEKQDQDIGNKQDNCVLLADMKQIEPSVQNNVLYRNETSQENKNFKKNACSIFAHKNAKLEKEPSMRQLLRDTSKSKVNFGMNKMSTIEIKMAPKAASPAKKLPDCTKKKVISWNFVDVLKANDRDFNKSNTDELNKKYTTRNCSRDRKQTTTRNAVIKKTYQAAGKEKRKPDSVTEVCKRTVQNCSITVELTQIKYTR